MKQAFCAAFLVAAFLAGSPATANVDPAGKNGGPDITQLLLDKSARRLYLLSGRTPVRSYAVDLGSNPTGHKQHQGDGRTPEGLYYITHHNPGSDFHLSLGISYPNDRDRARARAMGRDPGGDIFIHGDMTEIFGLVRPGTPIFIKP